ncbi:uncharacterized protein LOC121376864 [Gigantopelta aegis]|uniref:uncharacterized protein LOC121376864 n=1 Tax=Gigantopelta aegis TaxID=1735272 RepID=UPI001B88B763|nr:uncharacterized protein LOC121376864 [Gigantopelta aegis]
MKFILLLLLVTMFVVNHEADAWRRWRLRRIVRVASRIYRYYRIYRDITGKRDIAGFDKNLDGLVDLSELEDVLSTRDAREILEMADDDGDSQVTMEEFQKVLTQMNQLE